MDEYKLDVKVERNEIPALTVDLSEPVSPGNGFDTDAFAETDGETEFHEYFEFRSF